MKKFRTIFSVIFSMVMVLTCAMPAMAAEIFSDVSADAYYAEAVTYASENGLISGTEQGVFSPDIPLSRGMLVTILWRNEGQPQAAPSIFTDVPSDSYYAAAIDWAAENGIVAGYGENRFGPNDPIERQQLAVILYRYAAYQGNDVTVAGNTSFIDSAEIAAYAETAVTWAQKNGIIAGKSGNVFDPTGQTTRAEAVTILYRYITKNAQENPNIPEVDKDTLVVYFSWSGNTEEMASYIAEQTGGDLLEIEPKAAYPTDYNETGDIAKVERDENARPEIANLPASIDAYDTILVGYPIWWHTAPMIIGTFLESYDLSGKEVYPFTQSASMDTEQFNQSIEFVREVSEGATVHNGLFARPSDTGAIDDYLSENGLIK